jgi:glycosyl transferase family 25
MILENIKIFCINLKRSHDRWATVSDNFDVIGQDVERFEAYEGMNLTKNDVPSSWGDLNFYGNGIAGCALSHYKLWEYILTTDLPYACILEDDAFVLQKIDNIEVHDNFDILYINERIGCDSYGRASYGCGTESYIVSREGCNKLLSICEDMFRPVDLRIQAHIRGFVENGHELCKGFSKPEYPFHSLKHDGIILEGYKYEHPLTKHEDYGVSFVNNINNNKMEDIEKVVYINLDHRTDRMESVVNELRKVFPKNKIIRFSAIKDDTHGGIGATKSHIAVLKMAIENKWKNVLILEDDMIWNNTSGFVKVENYMKEPYDVMVLGGHSMRFDKSNRLIHALSMTAYVVSNHYYNTLLANFEEGLDKFIETKTYNKYAIDQYWNLLMVKDNWKGIVPGLCTQKPGYSDIDKKNVNWLHIFN